MTQEPFGKKAAKVVMATALGAFLVPSAFAAPDDYTPLGIKNGPFTIFLNSSFGVEYNDNIFASRDGSPNKESDVILHVDPGIEAKGRFSGGSTLDLYTNANFGYYTSNDDETYTDARVGMRSRTFFTKAVSLKAHSEYGYLHEDRGDVNTIVGAEPVTYNRVKGDLALEVKPGRTGFTIGARSKGLFFNDQDAAGGGVNTQDHRDRWELEYFAEFSQDLDSTTGFFIRGTGFGTEYDNRPEPTFSDRDSQGYNVVAGARVKASGTINLEAYAGYLDQNFENPDFEGISDFTFGAGMTWTPSAFVEVTLDADRTVMETTQADFSSFINTQVKSRLSLFPAENITLWGEAKYINRDYQPDATSTRERTDDDITGEIGGQIKFNRAVGLGAFYNYRNRESDLSGFPAGPMVDFSRNKFMLELTLAR